MSRKIFALTALGTTLAMVLSACSGSSPGAGASSSSKAGKGGTLTILTQSSQIDHLDPQRNFVGEDWSFSSAYLVRTLTAYTRSPDSKTADRLVGDLATGTGEPTDGGKVWTFHLRDGVKWEDGSTVKCTDIKYGISRSYAQSVITDGPTYGIQVLDIPMDKNGVSSYKGPYASDQGNVKAFDKAVECSADGKTITFRLSTPVADFNYTAAVPAFGAVPKAKDTAEKYDDHVVSDGPYKISEYTKGQQLVLDRNPNWDSRSDPNRPAFPDKIVMKFGLDPSVIDQRLEADAGPDKSAVSRDQLGATALTNVFNNERFASRRVDVLNPYVFMLAINSDKVKNLKQRQAIQVAVDRSEIITVNGGKYAGSIADGVISPTGGAVYAPTGLWDSMFGQKIPDSGDPELAKKLIQESGEPMPTITYDYATSPVEDKEAASIQSSLAKAGINVTLNPLQQANRNAFELNPKTENELEWTGWASAWPGASTVIPPLFETGGGWPLSRANDPAFDAKSKAAKAQLDRSKQNAMWQELNKTAMANAWVVPLRYGRVQRLAGSAVGAANGKEGHVYMWAPFGAWPYADLYVRK